ncbi:MAG: 2-isopropylmalate synthase [Spirochaetae bacterium HGW-Spirochaetae-7]|jgi:methanogen homocitrate synthase|nr:MAG: 2-isopropylmalate synthase [Spirochaetae bacterium HGW-Spirochaetae-7]
MSETYRKDGEHWVSPYNFRQEVEAQREPRHSVLIHDATLRDGEQTPGVVFRKADKVAIAKALNLVGVDRIEAGMPAVSREDFEAIVEIRSLGLKSKIFTFARALEEDIDQAVACGAHGVVIEVPIGYPKLLHQFKWTWEDVFRKSVPIINYARSKGLYTVYFPYDSTRAREEDLDALLRGIMDESPPDSIGIVDTMGCATPEAIAWLTRKYIAATKLPVEIHTHNDFGLALATELAAVGAGASVVHSCVNGLGERTGNAPLEELVLALKLLYNEDSERNITALKDLSALVADLSGIPVARNKPVVGEENFTRESGIGVNLVVENPLVMFAVHPDLVGRKGKVVLGKKSGKLSVNYKLEELGLGALDDEQGAAVLSAVKDLGNHKRGLVDDDEFRAIVGRVRAGGQTPV